MFVVAIASQKGGSGKTTLSGHLAVEAERAGAGPVALIDTDPQGSLAQWWNARVAKTPVFAKIGVFDLQSTLQQMQQSGIRLVIIDTPPAITDAISHVMARADLVIAPTRPSPHDLRAVGATVDLALRHNRPLIFVINGATSRARINGEMAIALSQHGTVAPVTIYNRVDFAASMVDGRTVGEVVATSQSAKEITDLWIYVQDRLARFPALSPQTQPSHLPVGAPLGLSDESELPETPPLTPVSGGGSHTGDVKPAASSTSPPAEGQPRGSIELMSADKREESPLGRLFGGTERQTNHFGRRSAD